PIGARRPAVTQRLHAADVALLERQLDACADERIALRRFSGDDAPFPLHARFAHEHAESLRLVHHHGVGTRSEVAAIDRHLAARPGAVVALEADAIGDDDVRLWDGGIA